MTSETIEVNMVLTKETKGAFRFEVEGKNVNETVIQNIYLRKDHLNVDKPTRAVITIQVLEEAI